MASGQSVSCGPATDAGLRGGALFSGAAAQLSSEAEHSRRAKGEETQKPHEDHNLSYRFGAHSHGTPCVNA